MSKRDATREVHRAIEAGDAEALRKTLAAADEPSKVANAPDAGGNLPLEKAVRGGHVGLFSVLAEAGAKLHGKRMPLRSALARVAGGGDLAMLAELLRIEPAERWTRAERAEALERAADQNRPDVMTALPASEGPELGKLATRAAYLGHSGTLGWCLARGVAVQHTGMMGGETATLLHHAAGGGKAATTALLVDAGADLDARDARGRTPLMYAAKDEPRIVTDRAAEAAKLALAREEGRVIYAAADADPPPDGRPDTALGLLIAAGADPALRDDDGLDALAVLQSEYRTALDGATAARPGELLDLATAAAAAAAMIPVDAARDMWMEDAPGDAAEKVWAAQDAARARIVMTFATALRRAGAAGEKPADRAVADATRTKDAQALRTALAAGGSVGATMVTRNGHGATTPLGWAAARGDLEVCRVLLDAGADPNDGGRDGPPLIDAARAGRLDVVRLLLDRGADPTKPDPHDPACTALDAARIAGRNEIVALLRAAGVGEPDATQPFKPDASFMWTATELLVKAGARGTADAVARAIGGKAEHGVLHKTITAASRRGYLVVQLDGSDWTSVLPHVGASRIPDEPWQDLARDVSGRTGTVAALLNYEKVSGQHAYRLFEAGRQVEHFQEDLGDPDLGDMGKWESGRGRPRPKDMEQGHRILRKLAEDERFCVFLSNPGGTPGEPFEVSFPGDRRRIVEVAYVRA